MISQAEDGLQAQLLAGGPLDLRDEWPKAEHLLPELAALIRGPVGNVYDGLEHTERMLARVRPLLRDLPTEEAQALYLGALLHQVGRRPTGATELDLSRHEQVGVSEVRDLLFRLRLPGPLRDHVVYLVRSQSLPMRFNARQVRRPRLLRLAWTLNTRLLHLLATADLESLDLPAHRRYARNVAAYHEQCEGLGIWGLEPLPLLSRQRWAQMAPTDPWLKRRVAGEVRHWRVRGRISGVEEAQAWLAEQMPVPAGALYLLVGVPGSGKSTWVRRHLARAHSISMDDLRERLLGSRADQGRNRMIFGRAWQELSRALSTGETTVWDAQSHTWASRQGLLDLAREHHAYVVVVYFDVPLAVALERNAGRPVVVPPDVVRRSYHDLQEPRHFEAEELWRVDADGDCTRYVSDETVGA